MVHYKNVKDTFYPWRSEGKISGHQIISYVTIFYQKIGLEISFGFLYYRWNEKYCSGRVKK